MQAAILAGGLGTRLRPLTNSVPKAMIPVNGRPFLEYEVDLLRKNEINDLVLCLGYLGEQVEEHFGDGTRFGVKVRYSHDGNELLGPIGGLKMAERLLEDEFFVTYGDAYLRTNYAEMMATLRRSTKPAVMAVYKNEGKLGKSDVIAKDGLVTAYDKKKTLPGMIWVNFGVSAMKKEALRSVVAGKFCDEETFYGGLVKRRQLAAYETFERFYEIGSERSLAEFRDFVSSPVQNETGRVRKLVGDLRKRDRGEMPPDPA
ncbi:MAG: NTP transferase domain-containing protein [Nitrososphaerota archaeon]|nr:NTP transferase domain-containing protein [Nitrososphaerota archaeon]MDG7023120.1 NTP transferase domain-containing protein [Nitrososphaerota archaeon]